MYGIINSLHFFLFITSKVKWSAKNKLSFLLFYFFIFFSCFKIFKGHLFIFIHTRINNKNNKNYLYNYFQ